VVTPRSVVNMHDCAITKNLVVLMWMPFEANIERVKEVNAGQIPETTDIHRCPSSKARSQVRLAARRNNAWEDDNHIIHLESTRVHDNTFGFFPSEDGYVRAENTKADFVRWIVLSLQTPQLILRSSSLTFPPSFQTSTNGYGRCIVICG
jgi:hypothetical protein